MRNVLIVDDDESFATALAGTIRDFGHTSEWATNGEDGLAKFYDGDYDVVIADLRMPRMNGVEFISEIKKMDKNAVVMVITGYADIQGAVETLTLGAYDFLEKPVDIERFRLALQHGLEKRQLVSQLNFSRGLVSLILISIPLWMVLGIILTLFLKR